MVFVWSKESYHNPVEVKAQSQSGKRMEEREFKQEGK